MAEQYAPIAKDESFNTTDLTPKNIADVLKDGLQNIADSVKPTADEIPFDNTGTSLVSTDVEGAIKELAEFKHEAVPFSGTTDSGGTILINTTTAFNVVWALSNLSNTLALKYKITVDGIVGNSVRIRYRNMSDNSAVANTSITDTVLLIGY